MELILVRYVGEIGTKGKNRPYFVKRLRRNLRDALKQGGVAGNVWSEGQRIYVEVEQKAAGADSLSTALSNLERVFGVASLSPVSRVPSDLDAIRSEALALAERTGLRPPMTFRTSARRADKSFPYISPEINRIVGGAVQEATQARVDLSDAADLTIGIEVRHEGTLVYGHVIPGPGGMPLGTQGRAFALLSGGIDSPAAMWLMMRRGCGIIPIHFAQSEIEKRKALDNCHQLEEWSFGWRIKPIVLDHYEVLEPVADRLKQMGEERWTCLFCKRAMIAKAGELAADYRVQALVMGDSLGQVASQTLNNMVAISWQSPLPILRPLIAYDKNEITDLARRIGTFETSIRESAACPFLPHHPITNANLEHLQEIIARLAE
jgi:thiamine biosynthesis protein ThiI